MRITKKILIKIEQKIFYRKTRLKANSIRITVSFVLNSKQCIYRQQEEYLRRTLDYSEDSTQPASANSSVCEGPTSPLIIENTLNSMEADAKHSQEVESLKRLLQEVCEYFISNPHKKNKDGKPKILYYILTKTVKNNCCLTVNFFLFLFKY